MDFFEERPLNLQVRHIFHSPTFRLTVNNAREARSERRPEHPAPVGRSDHSATSFLDRNVGTLSASFQSRNRDVSPGSLTPHVRHRTIAERVASVVGTRVGRLLSRSGPFFRSLQASVTKWFHERPNRHLVASGPLTYEEFVRAFRTLWESDSLIAVLFPCDRVLGMISYHGSSS